MWLKIKILKEFLGKKAFRYLAYSILIGICWFLIESIFIWVVQAFLFSLNLIPKSDLRLPDWVPLTPEFTCFILILYGLGRAILSWLRIHLSTVIGIVYSSHKRRQLIQKVLGNPRLSTHELMVNFSENIETSSGVILQMSQGAVTATSTILFFCLGLKLAPKEMLLGLLALGLLLLPLRAINSRVDDLARKAVRVREDLSKSLLLTIRNLFLLELYNVLNREKKKKVEYLLSFEDFFQRYSKYFAFKASLPLFLGVTIISLITFFSRRVWNTEGVILISFFYIFIRLAQSASELSGTFVSFRMAFPFLKKLKKFEEDFGSEDFDAGEQRVDRSRTLEDLRKIELSGVSFQYGSSPVLEDVNFSWQAGELALIKGPSGSGKSTLVKLLVGMEAPTRGIVRVNDHQINGKFDFVRDRIGYVGPEPFLIPGSLRENLTYGLNSPVSDRVLLELCAKAKLESLIQGMPKGLDEFIFESAQISTGQKQRIAIARALARHPKMLIMDEATANLDSETEAEIIKEIVNLKQELMILVISHKGSFDHVADRILRL